MIENPDGNDRMTLHVAAREGAVVKPEAVIAAIRDVTKLRAEVKVVAPADMPNDGKVIDDRRKFD